MMSRKAASKFRRLEVAARHACRELASARAHLDGTLIEDAKSLRAQIVMTLDELRAALYDGREALDQIAGAAKRFQEELDNSHDWDVGAPAREFLCDVQKALEVLEK
jgi:5'-deoxynucleotidase YfbR-like HD superfamily hydrolase